MRPSTSRWGAGRLWLSGRGLGEVASPRPFVGEEDHGLGEVERPERGVDGDRDDRIGKRHVLGFEPGSLRSEQDRAALFGPGNPVRHFLRPQHGHDEVAPPDRRGKDLVAVGDGGLDRVVQLRAFENDVGAARGRAGLGIGPAVARGNQPHLGQPEIEHGARRFADVLAELRPNEDDDGFGGHKSLSWLAGEASFSTRSAISAKSPGSLKSL